MRSFAILAACAGLAIGALPVAVHAQASGQTTTQNDVKTIWEKFKGSWNQTKGAAKELPFDGNALGELVAMVDGGSLSATLAKEVFEELATQGGSPKAIVDRRGLSQIGDDGALDSGRLRTGLYALALGYAERGDGGSSEPMILADEAVAEVLLQGPADDGALLGRHHLLHLLGQQLVYSHRGGDRRHERAPHPVRPVLIPGRKDSLADERQAIEPAQGLYRYIGGDHVLFQIMQELVPGVEQLRAGAVARQQPGVVGPRHLAHFIFGLHDDRKLIDLVVTAE